MGGFGTPQSWIYLCFLLGRPTTPKYTRDTCTYSCNSNGSCDVEYWHANGPYVGNTKGSCFPPSFGGDCSGTPRFCEECISKCQGKGFGSFDEEVWRIIRILSTICISEKMSLMKFEWNEVMHF